MFNSLAFVWGESACGGYGLCSAVLPYSAHIDNGGRLPTVSYKVWFLDALVTLNTYEDPQGSWKTWWRSIQGWASMLWLYTIHYSRVADLQSSCNRIYAAFTNLERGSILCVRGRFVINVFNIG